MFVFLPHLLLTTFRRERRPVPAFSMLPQPVTLAAQLWGPVLEKALFLPLMTLLLQAED
jgi:hypothetical protein